MKTDGTNPPGQGIFGLIDINCHILPGTEDGPDNFREAAEMLRIAYDEGIRTIVATPPYNKKNPIMDGDKLDRLVEQLNVEAGKIDPDYRVYLGREIEYNDENHQKIISGQLDSMADSKYVMIRFPYDVDFETISEAIRDINMDGYIPIVANVEQYECLEEDEDKVEELIQFGAYVQISASWLWLEVLDMTSRIFRESFSRESLFTLWQVMHWIQRIKHHTSGSVLST